MVAIERTRILRQPHEAGGRLTELMLDLAGLLEVRDRALAAAADATPFHAANAAGTFAYHAGIFGLRSIYEGEAWKRSRPEGVEVIANEMLRTRVSFCNVAVACSDTVDPKPKSEKGNGSERAAMGNLFGALPQYAPRMPASAWRMYYLMVDGRGAAELTLPVIADHEFIGFVERIYLSDGSDFGGRELKLDNDDAIVDFDPAVSRIGK